MTGGSRFLLALAVTSLMAVTGCQPETAAPGPRALTREAVGHYCNMIVVDHPGPKAQIHESGRAEPLWFSSVRDALAYLSLPGEAQRVTAAYVHDMGRAESWKRPQNDGIWVKAEEVFYVIESKRRGGMGARETVPFADRSAAKEFLTAFGGRMVPYSDIPTDYIIGDSYDHRDTALRDPKPIADVHHGH